MPLNDGHRRLRAPGRMLLCAVLVASGMAATTVSAAAPAAAAAVDLACTISSGTGIAAANGARIHVLDAMAAPLPRSSLTGATGARLCQARNAIVSFQVAVAAPAGAAVSVSAAAAALTGPAGAVIGSERIRLFREDYVTLGPMSDSELGSVIPRDASGQCTAVDCRYPDLLVPAVDPFTGASRAVFPVSAPAGQNRAIWVDVDVPASAVAGTYTGAVTVSVDGVAAAVPVTLEVIDATVPAYGSAAAAAKGTTLRSSFVLDNVTSAKPWSEYAAYARLGLDNGISVTPDGKGPGGAGFPDVLVGLMAGTDGQVGHPGATLSDITFNKYMEPAQLAGMRTALAVPGVRGRSWHWCDEPSGGQTHADCKVEYAEAVAPGAWPDLRLMAIRELNQQVNGGDPAGPGGAAGTLDPEVGALVVLVNYLHPIPGYVPTTYGGDTSNRMPAFSAWRNAQGGREVWGYTSCMSAGCTSAYTPAAIYRGWPSYGIDKPATTQAAMGWQSFLYDLDGEHYWNVSACRTVPVSSCIYFNGDSDGMNGDGTLFYTPAQAGLPDGSAPVESVRLKRIRDGRTAFALLRMASGASADGPAQARAIASAAFPSMSSSAPSTGAYATAVEQLIELVAGLVDEPPTIVVPSPPQAVSGTPGDGKVTVSWSAPQSDGGAPVLGYRVSTVTLAGHLPPTGSGTCETVAATPRSCTVTTLANGGQYRFTVQARNSAGWSAPSAASAVVIPLLPALSVVTPPAVVGAPTLGAVLRATRGVWTGSNEGLDSLSYTYEWLRSGKVVPGRTASSYTVGAADAGTALAVRVTVNGPGYRRPGGVASSVSKLVPRLAPTVSSSLPKRTITRVKRGKVKVVVTVPGVSDPILTVQVRRGTRLLASVTLRVGDKGRRTIVLPRLRRGTYALVVTTVGTTAALPGRAPAKRLVVR